MEKEKDKWRFINAIIHTGKDLQDDPDFETEYNHWFIGRSLSYHRDTIAFADNVNRLPLTKQQHFRYLLCAVPKRKRFAKFYYPVKEEIISVLMEYFQCNERRAREYKEILTAYQLTRIQNFKGGVKK